MSHEREPPENPMYLGDGLYASHDGYQFRIWTERLDGVHEVFLDRHVFSALIIFAKRLGMRLTIEKALA